jgi:hypothetical protein
MINTWSLKTDRNIKIAPNFTVGEFACKDGTDQILIADTLPLNLQKIRDHFAVPVFINSGYRTVAYNTKIKGAKGSHHTLGEAADIDVGQGAGLVNPLLVCMYAQTLGLKWLGAYQFPDGQSWSHIDVHPVRGAYWRQYSSGGARVPIATFLPILKREFLIFTRPDFVKVLQAQLTLAGYTLVIDGKFGKATQGAVKAFQLDHGLVNPDGIVDLNTWKAIL